jgi:hypothetical protein
MPQNIADPLETSSPYDDDFDDVYGRFVVQGTPLSFYNLNTNDAPGGQDRTVPYPNETAFSEDDYALYILTRDPATNQVVPRSHSKDLEARLNEYENSGIFDNAMAFMFNKEIYRLYFDLTRHVVKPSSGLKFDASYRYYAIKANTSGPDNYFTGIVNSETGDIISNLVDMDMKTDADGVQYSEMTPGFLCQDMVHANMYVVEFYDDERILQDQKTFQGVSVRHMTISDTPEAAIVGLKIMTNYPYESEPYKAKLPQGSSYEHLGLRVYVEYAGDNQYREVTHEVATGKLIITGLEDLDTSELTSDTGVPQEVEVRYVLNQASVVPGVPVEQTAGQLTITKILEVYIVENVADIPYDIIFAAWVDNFGGPSGQLPRHVNLRLFGLYSTGPTKDIGVLRDITKLLKNTTIANFDTYYDAGDYFIGSAATITGTTQEVQVVVPYGLALQTMFIVNYMASTNQNDNKVRFSTGTGIPVKVNKILDYVEPSHNFRFNTANQGNNVQDLINEFTYTEGESGDITPTHIRIRNAKNPNIIYRELYDINNINSLFNAQNYELPDWPIVNETPVIVEFIHVYSDDGGITIDSTVCTGAGLFYINSVPS